MKITSFSADRVHGYLPLRLNFHSDLTFLTGLNGSGKTSALRLLMGLLTPQIEQLASIEFDSAAVDIIDQDRTIKIAAARTAEGLALHIDTLSEPLKLTITDLQLLSTRRDQNDLRAPVLASAVTHPVWQAISQVTTPMFLGLDRRIEYVHTFADDLPAANEQRRRELLFRHREERNALASTTVSGLADIQILLQDTFLSVRAAQDKLDQSLRSEMLLEALKYTPTDLSQFTPFPDRNALAAFKTRKAGIEQAATRLALPIQEVQSALTSFFEKMDELVARLERSRATPVAKKQRRKKLAQSQPTSESEADKRASLDWLLNKSQFDRIVGHLERLHSYWNKREELQTPIALFTKLVNEFLEQTGKKIAIDDTGRLFVVIGTDEQRKPLTALSSGERQIVVMLAHLSLNRQLQTSGVFIVDEPELSLHVSWQERFVDAIQQANPQVQLIMATHSPAIILDRDDACVSLSPVFAQ
jgi:predicted ATP-dependent endonuclease of OLD family